MISVIDGVGWLCWGLTSQSTIFQSCRDGAIASWVINQYFRGVKCLAQGHNTAAVGLEPRTSRSGVRHSTTEPPRSPNRWCKREYVEPDALKEKKVSIFKTMDQRIKFYSQNTNLLPPKPKSTFRHLKQGIKDFHRKYVLVPADKAVNNVVVVWRLHYINTLKQELSGTKAYKETSEEEKSVVNGHCNHLALKFSVCVKERQDRLPTMYWLPKLHKTPYKARFIANSSSCTTTELSKLLTSCLTAVKNHVIRYCEKVYERSGKNLFWSIKNSGEVLNKLKSRGFRATSLSTYDFSTLYTTLPHNLIKEKLINLIGWTFKREGSPYIACNERQAFFTSENDINFDLAKTSVKP